jgi:hypothetical protein
VGIGNLLSTCVKEEKAKEGGEESVVNCDVNSCFESERPFGAKG